MKKFVLAILIIAGCTTSLIILFHGGISSRVQGRSYALDREHFPVYIVKNTVDVYSLWQNRRVHGRIVVHLGRFLHFMEVGGHSSSDSPQIATIVADHKQFKIEQTSYKDFLWAAFQTNIARELYTVLPISDFMTRFDTTQMKKEIVKHEYGSLRIFTVKIPSVKEPVLLNIDASFFATSEPAQVMDDLLKSGLRADIVTICLAEDNPDVTNLDRQKARAFITLLTSHADVTYYNQLSQTSKGIK